MQATDLAEIAGSFGIDLKIEKLDSLILKSINQENCVLDMSAWHRCETTHCRAGWAIHLKGEDGYGLEKYLGSSWVGAAIYVASYPDNPIPNFHADIDDAMNDIKARAAKDAA